MLYENIATQLNKALFQLLGFGYMILLIYDYFDDCFGNWKAYSHIIMHQSSVNLTLRRKYLKGNKENSDKILKH